MCQTLFYIPFEIFGFPVFGFGLALVPLVMVIVAAAAWRFAKTKKFDEDIGSYFGLLVIGGAILVFVAPNVLEPGLGFPIRGYGVFLLIAILSSLALVIQLTKRKNIPSDQIFSLCLWAVLSGIAGARIFYVTEYWHEMVIEEHGALQLLPTLYNFVNIANGGLVVFGSIIGGGIGSCVFIVRNKMPLGATFDAMAPAMMLGIAIGRIGCLMNGCCYGGVTDLAWGIVFPVGSPAHLHQIEHNEVFYNGLKFKEIPVDGKTLLAIEAVQPESDAQCAGLKPEMLLRGLGGMENGKPFTWEVGTKLDMLRLISHLQSFLPNTPNTADASNAQNTQNTLNTSGKSIRFDVYTNPARTETSPYFVALIPSAVLPVHPTQIYSSLTAIFLCGVLLFLRRLDFFRRCDGLLFAAFLILYSTARFCLEMIRTDEDSFLGTGLTISQNVCILAFAAGMVLVFILAKKRKAVSVG